MPIIPPGIDALAADLRGAVRYFRRLPGFTLVVLLTLGVGIGATTTIFSLVHGVLLRPLSYPNPDRLVMVCETSPEMSTDSCAASPANWADWRRRSRVIETFGLGRNWPFGVRQEGRTRGVSGGIATPGLFETFGARPALGRLFDSRDIEPGTSRVAIVSHGFWQSWLGGSKDAVGGRLEIEGEVYEIVGVLPPDFTVPRLQNVELWIPLWPERLPMRGWRGFLSFGRLASGATLTQAQAEMDAVRAGLAREFPETNAAWGVHVESLLDRTVRGVRPALLIFFAAVSLVLVIACANVANLFLARGASREREFAVRLALGASRRRLVQQLLLESFLLALCGGAIGVLGAYWAMDAFAALAPAWFPRLDAVHLDGGVLAFTMAVTTSASLFFGLAPALQAARVDLNRTLRDAGSAGGRGATRRAREILVITEIALACLLLVGAGLLLRSFGRLLDWKPGFDRGNLAFVQVFASSGKYPTAGQRIDLFRRCVEEIRALPSVVAAGAGSALPLFGGDGAQEFFVEGRPEPGAGQKPSVRWYDVDPDYFRTLRIPLERGRLITAADGPGAPRVAVINETMARRYFAGEDPVGRRVHMVAYETTLEIVGVVGDVQPFRPDEAPEAEIYWPFAQASRGAIVLIARTAGPPSDLLPAIQSRLATLDPDLDIGRMTTMDAQVADELVNPRFNLILVGVFALVATLMALIGIYGVVSFSTAQRTREIGVRMALGALRGDILRMVLGQGLALAAAGLAAGLVGAFCLTRFLRALLVGVEPADPATFTAISLLFLAVAAAACYLPARRATRVDPLVALRHE
jgi:putative ABC transport system permease protein